VIAVHRRARRVDHALHAGVLRRDHHVEERVDVVRVRRERVLDRPRHRAERGLVEHDVDVLHRLRGDGGIAEISLDEAELQPLVGVDREHVVDVPLVAGEQTVDADHGLSEVEQSLEECRADEACDAGHEPAAWRVDEILADLVVARSRCHSERSLPDYRLQNRIPRGAL
jgi:hypothetical protein